MTKIVCDECDQTIQFPNTEEIKISFVYSTPDGEEQDKGEYCSWKCLKKAIRRVERV
jgi:hypothetical protein